jgi:DNA-binding MarR family transcriptional regulator
MPDISQITTYQAAMIQSIAHRQLGTMKNKILKDKGLSMMQWVVLGYVHDSGEEGTRISEIAEALGTTLAFITSNVNILESKNFVTKVKHEHDSRARLVSFRPEQEQQFQKIELEVRDELRKTIYSKVSREELNNYVNTLYKFADK